MSTISLVWQGVTVDLSNNHCNVEMVVNNPLLSFAIPASDTTPNEIAIDLSLLSIQYMLTFDLTDGIGTLAWGGGDTGPSGTTKFEKLAYMARSGSAHPLSPVTFTWWGGTVGVKIASFRAGTSAGKKRYMQGCTMTLQQAMDLTVTGL